MTAIVERPDHPTGNPAVLDWCQQCNDNCVALSDGLCPWCGSKVVPNASRGLAELAATAAREHELAVVAGLTSLQHAINAGAALLAAKEQVPYGQWGEWLETNFRSGSITLARIYMRLAKHRDALERREAKSLREAMDLLRGEPDTRVDPGKRARARGLAAAGRSYGEIAEALDVSKATVHNWVAQPKRVNRRDGEIFYVNRSEARAIWERINAVPELEEAAGKLRKIGWPEEERE